jgi:uncharacterized membrane protein
MGIDLVWLGILAKDFYRSQLGSFLKESYNMQAALLFYLVYIAGIVFFVLSRAITTGSWQYALFAGMFYGFVTYSTYGITNYSTIKDWPTLLTVIDIGWGTVLCGITSYLTYLIATNINFFSI